MRRNKTVELFLALSLAVTLGACNNAATEGGDTGETEDVAPATEEVAPEGGEGGEGGEG